MESKIFMSNIETSYVNHNTILNELLHFIHYVKSKKWDE